MIENTLKACKDLTAFTETGDKRVITNELFESVIKFAYESGKFDGIISSSKAGSSVNLPVQPE